MFFQIESIQQNVFGTWINPLNQSNSCPNKHCDIFISPAQLLAGVLGKKCSATDVNLVNLDIGRCSLCCQLPSHTANLMNSPNTSITRGDLVLKSMANKQLRRLQQRKKTFIFQSMYNWLTTVCFYPGAICRPCCLTTSSVESAKDHKK